MNGDITLLRSLALLAFCGAILWLWWRQRRRSDSRAKFQFICACLAALPLSLLLVVDDDPSLEIYRQDCDGYRQSVIQEVLRQITPAEAVTLVTYAPGLDAQMDLDAAAWQQALGSRCRERLVPNAAMLPPVSIGLPSFSGPGLQQLKAKHPTGSLLVLIPCDSNRMEDLEASLGPRLVLIQCPAAGLRPLLESQAVALLICQRPDFVSREGEHCPSDPAQAFERRYLALRHDNLDRAADRFPRLFEPLSASSTRPADPAND